MITNLRHLARNGLVRAGYQVRGAKGIELPPLFADQQAVYDDPARFKVMACGRRWGKTTLNIRILADHALLGETWGYFSLTYKNMAETFRALRHLLSPEIKHSSLTEGRIELLNGGLVEFWSLQTTSANTIRGRKYHGAILDEVSFIPDAAYAWDAVIRPLLVDYQGKAIFSSTPHGRNQFYYWYLLGQDPTNDEWKAFHFPTSSNPYLDAKEMESVRRSTPDLTFQEEYLAVFNENEGSVFRKVMERAILQKHDPYTGRIICGLDWGNEKDFTVILAMDADSRQVLDYDRFNHMDWALQRQRIITFSKRWQPQVIWAEANSIGGPNIEELRRSGLSIGSFDTTALSKPPLIENLILAFDRGEITILNDPLLTGELMAYERRITSTGRSQYTAPDGLHDDMVIALALAWYGVSGQGGTRLLFEVEPEYEL